MGDDNNTGRDVRRRCGRSCEGRMCCTDWLNRLHGQGEVEGGTPIRRCPYICSRSHISLDDMIQASRPSASSRVVHPLGPFCLHVLAGEASISCLHAHFFRHCYSSQASSSKLLVTGRIRGNYCYYEGQKPTTHMHDEKLKGGNRETLRLARGEGLERTAVGRVVVE